MSSTAITTEIRTRTEQCARMLAGMVQARINCIASGNTEWRAKHEENAEQLVRDLFPSGSGWDHGTRLDWDKSTGEKLVLYGAFHHMDDAGGYDGWTDHQVIVRASLMSGLNIRITGRDRNDVKEYLRDTFDMVLSAQVTHAYNMSTGETTFELQRQ